MTNKQDCRDCPLVERRAFLGEAGFVLAGLALALGGAPESARALTVTFGRALSHAGEEHSYAIPAEDGAMIDRDAELIVVRYHGKAYVFNLSCPHQRTALRWWPEDGQFQCPKHHSRYTPDGVFISGRATRSMDRFGVRKDGGNIVADLDKFYRQDEHPAEWGSAFIEV
ncbi:MAG: ubiquinol-cytochrome c reductase iron-sulfur subunit [Gemmatimonadales bacterium]